MATIRPGTGRPPGEQPPPPPRHALAGWIAALVGVLAVGAGLGFGDLVAGLVAPPSSPLLAVGAQFIRLTPEWLKEFATSTFGTNDKLVLLVSMAVVIAVLAVAAGLASRRRATPGVMVIAVLGLAGVAAAAAAPAFRPIDLVAPVVALLVGVGAFLTVHRRASATARTEMRTGNVGAETGALPPAASEPGVAFTGGGADAGTGAAQGGAAGLVARRRMLLTGAAVAVGAAAAGTAGRLLAGSDNVEAARQRVGPIIAAGTPPPAPPVTADFVAQGTPPWLTPAAEFYRIDTALQVPRIPVADYRLRIHGMVDRELNLTYEDLRRRTLVEAPITMTCVSNEVGGNLISNARFTGVPLHDLLLEAGVRPGAQQIASTSVDGWTSGTPVDVVMEPDQPAMLALGMNGAALPVEHGFPVRMVVSGLYGFVSGCKWITDMEITTFGGFTSYWEQRGWAQKAPIKTESRIDSPKPGATVAAGRVTLAGIAWAQHSGITGVEVRADAGPWQPAELASELSRDSWRMWRATINLPPGTHTLQVRATDSTGYRQTPRLVPAIPDGASGWHTITVTAA